MYTACYNVLWKKCSKRVDKFESKTWVQFGQIPWTFKTWNWFYEFNFDAMLNRERMEI